MHLVVVESPAKCKKISSFLGPSYRVIASMGHIRALEETLDAVGLDRDFEPRFTFLKEKSKALHALKEAASGVDTVYLAADDDREGEAIAYSVAVFLRRDPLKTPRIVFHEITKTAIQAAIANPRSLNMDKVNAQQARAVLDMMVGFTISPLLWKFVAPSLSAGRCQTPALRLVCDREQSIQNHTSTSSWVLRGSMVTDGARFGFDATMKDELDDQESAMNYMENIHTSSAVEITGNSLAPWYSNPPAPLITSTLQQETSALYHCGPKQTMRIAQELYEGGHITYMRTDSTAMSEEARQEGCAWIREKYGEEYCGPVSAGAAEGEKEKKGKGGGKKKGSTEPGNSPLTPDVQAQEAHELSRKNAKAGNAPQLTALVQEAHECIRPTHMEVQELPSDWSTQHRNIYGLIWRRAIQSLMSAARGEKRTVLLRLVEDTDAFPWISTWQRTLFQGWKMLGATAKLDDEEGVDEEGGASEEKGGSEAGSWKASSELAVGLRLQWKQLQATPRHTKPAGRFTEATLVRELESKGIGRPSTFASLVETLIDKAYVEKRDIPGTTLQQTTLTLTPEEWPPAAVSKPQKQGAEKGKLIPTPLGVQALSFCVKEFPELFAYSFTANMEASLDAVSKGEKEWKEVCRATWGAYKAKYEALKAARGATVAAAKQKDFGGGLKACLTKKGPLIIQEAQGSREETVFYAFPDNATFETITEEAARAWIAAQKKEQEGFGEYKGAAIIKKSGKYGLYVECGSLKCPIVEGDTREEIIAKLAAREEGVVGEHIVGPYTFRKGKYGPYMYKTALKKKVFVSVSDTLEWTKLTAADADALYKAGAERAKEKATATAAAGGTADSGEVAVSGTSARGRRGGWRGRGGRGGRGSA